jgi:hypothetical protein
MSLLPVSLRVDGKIMQAEEGGERLGCVVTTKHFGPKYENKAENL